MFLFVPSFLLVLLLAAPALLTPSTSQELEVRGQRTPRDTKEDSIKVVITEGCATQGDSANVNQGGKEIDLSPGSPLVLTHKIKFVPSSSGSGSGPCGCEKDFAALRERLERLEREVSALREKCGGAEGSCCTSKESKGAGCSIKPEIDECPNECSDQGRCVEGKCVCFPGFSGPDCGESNCPGNCNDKGRCVNGQCVCDPGFTGPDCSQGSCPDNCNNRGRCVNGRCVCDSGFTGPSCSDESCPGNCNNKGRCVNRQCVCNPGFTGPDCSKKACPKNCSDRGRCVNGKCVCDSGFAGADCSEKSCPGNCNNRGRCINGQCVCKPAFTGPDCSTRACPDNCNNRGRCVNGNCVCHSGFTGADCSEIACPGNCNGRGRCIDGECVCSDGFSGPDCSEKTCPNDCYDRGRCVDGKCVCDSGFTGDDCSEKSCPGNCNNRGRCVNGQCVCNDGFTGSDCSERSCPENCNNRGRCVNGQCVCNDGFTGSDCSEKSCPGNCNNRGRCVNGQCVCNDGFTGSDCSEKSCPGNCNNRGRCVNGQCVCNDGFTGADCSEKACPNNCKNHGKCVNGVCVCDVGFAGPDCTAKSCPNNCSNKGRCIKGRCVCRRGFIGPDCSQCEEGKTGPNCDTVMLGVSQLSTRDITETSVTLVWTPPPVQYDSYHITFTSQKESDQQITVQVEGSLTTFTQMGLAAGQEYTVSITGEIEGRRGAESSSEFMTLISGPTNLQVVKTTTTSAVVQWEHSQGEIDRYRLTVTPNDGAGRSQEMTIPGGQNSAHIQQLEAGRLYDIALVAEKDTSRSEPTTTQVTPGKTLPRVTVPALTTQVTLPPGQDVDDRDQKSSEVQVFDQEGRKKADPLKVRGSDGPDTDSTAPVIARTKPLVNKKMAINGTRKPNVSGPFRFNTTRFVPVRKVGQGPLKKPLVGEKKKVPVVRKKPKPGVPIIRDRTIALTETDPSVEESSTESRDAKDPALMSGTDSDTNSQSSLEKPTIPAGSTEQPDVGMVGHGNDTDSVLSEPIGTVQSQEKKCMNKVKVTHFRLPLKDKGNGCRGDGTLLVRKILGSHQGSSETDVTPDSKPSSTETDVDYSTDPLHKLLMNTFENMNITTFSVHLSKPSNLSVVSENLTKQILRGLKPLSSIASSSSSTSQSSSHSSDEPSSSLPSSSPSSSSLVSSPSSSLTYLDSSSHSSPSPRPSLLKSSSLSPPSSSISSSDESGSVRSNKLDVDNSKTMADVASPEDRKQPPSGKGGVLFFRRTPTKNGFVRRLRPNFKSLHNKTHPHMTAPHHSPPHLNLQHTPTSELLTSPSSSTSIESSSVEVNVPASDTSGYKNGETTPAPIGVGQNEEKMPTKREQIPNRRLPQNGRYLHRPRPNFGPLQNRTRPNLRPLPPPSQSLNPASETRKEQVSTTELPATSSPVAKEAYPTESTGPIGEENADKIRTSMSTEFNQTSRGGGLPSSHRPTTRVGYFRRLYNQRLQNKTRPNLRSPQHPHRGPVRKPFPTRKLNEGNTIAVGSQTNQLEKVSTPEIPDNQPGEPDSPMPTQGVQIRQSGKQDTTEVIPSAPVDSLDTTIRPQTNELEGGLDAPVQTTKSREEETRSPDPNLDSEIHKETSNPARPQANRLRGGQDDPVQTTKSREEETRSPDPNSDSEIHKETGNPARPQANHLRGGQDDPVQTTKSREEETTTPDPNSDIHKDRVIPVRPQTNELEGGQDAPVQTTKPEKETRTPEPNSDSDIHKERVNPGNNTSATSRGRPTIKQTSSGLRHGVPNKPPVRSTQMRHYISGSQMRENTKRNITAKRLFDGKPEQTESKSKPLTVSDVSSSGVTREPLDSVEVTNRTSDGFMLTWDSPEGKYKNFVVTRKEVEKPKQKESKRGHKEEPEDSEKEEVNRQPTKEDENRLPESVFTQSSTTAKPVTGSDKIFKTVLPGSARSFQFEDLPRQTDYTVTLLGKGPGLLSRLHKLVISTGPEPPTNIVFSKVTEDSLTVSWTKPKSAVSGFKVTYTHTDDGEPVSVSVDSGDSSVGLSQLSPGSSYEVNVISILGLDESDPIRDFVRTLPDPPTDLRAVNVTDTKALLLWRPALATVDEYTIVYGAGTGSELRVMVSGNEAEHQLSGLEGSTTYTVTISSRLGNQESSPATTSFTTTKASGNGPQDLQASNVTPRTALLSWKRPPNPVGSYRLTYQTEGHEMKEVIVGAAVTEYNLTRLHPGSKYTVQLQAEEGGRYTSTISTEFTTGTLRFPFPTDCSQELLNGIKASGEVEIFPQGKLGKPVMVYCDMETDGGGWTVFQRRKDGSVNFFRGWKDYTKGFGDLSGEFWLGLDSLHNLTTMTRMNLRVDLRDKDESVYAEYSTFEVAKRNYRLTVGGYSGTAGDSFSYHNNRVFSTKDRDPTPFITRCAMSYRGGWWYKNCHEANLNGLYGIDVKHQGVIWTSWKGKQHSIPFTEMKMRPASFYPPVRG
ncbi:tenascin isoform X1 [Larimichthys crocea]|uniref:tenascin isoform X1 n=1 Tax=Larimichthys crocea TaxID=215358 RepID=UPI000F5DF227|nr:tenascin-X isoform X1 [Larimichthys crocea]